MDIQYTEQAKTAVRYGEKTAVKLQHNYTGTEHLLAGLVHESQGTAGLVLRELGVSEEKLMELIRRLIAPSGDQKTISGQGYTPRAAGVLEEAVREAEGYGSSRVGTEHLLLAMLSMSDCVGTRLLHTMGISIARIQQDLLAAMGEDTKEGKDARKKNNREVSRTPVLDQYSRDLTRMAREGKLDPVVGRDREITRIMQILSRRTKNNPCLIGEPGVGKTAIVEGLARRIAEGSVPDTIMDKRVVVLDLSSMVAGSKYRGEFEERIKKVLQEVMDEQRILLFLDELHTIIGAGGAEGALDASNILKPSLSRGEIQLIGATTLEEYRKYIEKDAALERRFQPVMVEEPSEEEAVEILKGLRPYYEQHHGVEITDQALEAAVKMSVRYIHDRFLPDKAIDLMDEAASGLRLVRYEVPEALRKKEEEVQLLKKEKEAAIKAGDFAAAKEILQKQSEAEAFCKSARKKYEAKTHRRKLQVTEDTVAEVVSGWTRIPVQRLAEKESRRLARLETVLKKRVVGQEEAVAAVAKAVKRGRIGLKDPARPIGSFLFLGPTGVGKTELSKALAEAVFGTEQALIRVDMSEYMEKHSVSKLIGSPPGYVGYDEGGQLSEKVRRNPYSVILFDEIEKAHPDVFNILLQVLDDGHITDAQGRKADFKQTCIIMTSNAGAQSIIEPKKLGFAPQEDEKKEYLDMKNRVMEEVRRIFKPEFLNRIDEILVFHPLNQGEIRQIVTILLQEFQKRCQEQMQLNLTIRSRVKEFLAEKGYDAKYGARPLKRAIQNYLEDALAEEILSGRVQPGNDVTVTVRTEKDGTGKIVFSRTQNSTVKNI